jgi:phospho-N-acetylmuramoyl-pentapeptide-transferase
MFYWLLYQEFFLRYPLFSAFRVFQYLTFRIAFASLTALFLSLILGPWLIGRLKEFQIGQFIREEGPRSHQAKAGTPTMGGVLIVISFLFPTLLWADLTNPYVWIALLATSAFAAVGFADDYLKIKNRRNLGLTGKTKLLLQVAIAFAVGIGLLLLNRVGLYSTNLIVPFAKNFRPDLLIDAFLHNRYTWPFAFLPFFFFVALVLVGSSNAVNLTDGLDGLASGLIIITGGALAVLTYVTGHEVFAKYLGIQFVPRIGELAVFCGAVVGSTIGFLWWNAHPAEIFMGDVGSLALGGAMGTVAVLIKQELLLPLIGGVFVAEALSVILQVGSYKLRNGKRIFKMAPLHHHFEALGWKESQVIIRFWIAGLILALFALTTLKLR